MSFKKLLCICSTAFFLLSMSSCTKGIKNLHDGTFIGKGSGRNGIIEVSINVVGGKITEAEIIKGNDTPAFMQEAKSQILSQFILEGGTANLDTISGATITSHGILDALDAAIAASQGYKQKSLIYHDTECDIVIIGAGGAGLTAATEAATKGARVIVLEKMGIVGGNTNFSTGGINAAYTKEQRALGIKDSKEVFFNDTMAGGRYLNNPTLVRKLVDESADIVEWLQSPLIGADLTDVGAFGGATNKRIHRPKGGAAIGTHLVPLLSKSAQAQGADIRLNNKVIDILEMNGKAVGVKVKCEENEYTINSKAVIIATGGFGANAELLSLYQPSLAGFATTNHAGATGDILPMVEKFNAELIQMNLIQTHPTVVKGTGYMITESVRGNGAILVNKNGKRFVNEMETRDIVSSAILRGPGKTAYLLFDQGIRESLAVIEDYASNKWMIEAKSLKDLAGKLKIDATNLEHTVQKYNHFVTERLDSDFERNPASMDRQIAKAPFYAIEVEPAIHHTMGGLKINENAQVIGKDGLPISGLYAAGEVTGGVHGAERLGGNAIADICIFGKIAADSALDFIQKRNLGN